MRKLPLLLCLLATLPCRGQTDSLPYAEIADYPADYSAGNVLARMIDALGFRYYWATEGLKEQDLAYRPSEDARSGYETIEHVYGLSEMIRSVPRGDTMVRPEDLEAISFAELREETLRRLAESSALYRGMSSEALADQRVMFSYDGTYSEHPLWNLINGPLADAIYHTGQLVTLRRSSGNPADSRVNHFLGKLQQ
ncbi:hypothetical protein CLV84_2324 [Neolewinella xylanilytica]|uniref:DinB family protein n=1 Tax=Neolewinella xylanilytica TaxID=1514080 RepID=A0A2S6I2M4_9BACT|nr:hypothetical protein [Neolewinella xylanilytica]PPK85427.1 hypothetical protein CLV84_2324 [Neolewinella xylanilytica]